MTRDDDYHAAVQPPKTRVLFISGFGRSGSTILGQILAGTPGFVHVGELNLIWEHNFGENRRCGCGSEFDECPFWVEVTGRAFGGFDGVDAREMMRLQHLGTRTRHGLLMLFPGLRSRLVRRLAPYVENMERLYRAVRDVSGANVVIDSSKLPPYGFLHSTSPGIDMRVVHLVRDSRATAYSWSRRPGTEGAAKEPYLPRIGTAKSAITWDAWNVVTELLWRHQGDRYLRIRYEDFVRDPLESARSIVTFAGMGEAALPFCAPRVVELGIAHTAAGNPNRFATGPVEIRADEQWRADIGRIPLAAVTALTLPLLMRYRYPLGRSGPSAR